MRLKDIVESGEKIKLFRDDAMHLDIEVTERQEKVLASSASGFRGSHVADQLSEAGYRVRINSRWASPWKHRNQEMIVGDVLDFDLLNKAITGANIGYNFAALAAKVNTSASLLSEKTCHVILESDIQTLVFSTDMVADLIQPKDYT